MNIRFPAGPLARPVGAAAAAALLLGAVATAGTATADTAGFRDARGDMAGHGADIHRVKVVNEKAVRISVRHADLVRSYESGAGIKVYLDTDRTSPGPEFVFMGGIFEGADYALQDAEGWTATGVVPLQRPYIMRLSYAKDVTRIRLSRKALGFPQEVRVTVKTGGELDGHQVTDWWKGTRALTPWVERG